MKIGFTSDERDAIIPESKTGRMWWIDEDGAEAQGGGRRSAAGRGRARAGGQAPFTGSSAIAM